MRPPDTIFRHLTARSPTPTGISVLDTGRILYANKAMLDMLGEPEEEVVGKTAFDVGFWESPDTRRKVIERVHAEGAVYDVELLIHQPRCADRMVLASFEAFESDDEEWLLVVIEDVTERMASAAALEEREEKLEAILDAAGEGVFGIDRDDRITFVNPAAIGLLGYDRADELLGRTFHEMSHHTRPDDTPYPAGTCPIHDTVAQGTAALVDDEVFWRRDSTSIAVEYRTNALTRNGDVVGAVVTFADITERAAARAALEEAKAHAEEVSEAKERFLSHLSHELRTPLNVVVGYADLIATHDSGPEVADEVEQIQRASRHLVNLIDEALDISRIDAGQIAINIGPVDVDELVAEVVSFIGPTAEAAEVAVRSDIPDGLTVRADNHRLRQVLLNLLSNAVKYNVPEGSVTITASGNRTHARIDVRDTGRGIPAERLASIFEPFERVEGDRSGVEGTGLGLALSRRLVLAMGGTITAHSEPDRGTTVTVELVRSPETVPEPVRRRGIDTESRSDGIARVLYVEDNPANLRLVESALDRLDDVELHHVMRGTEALAVAASEDVDLVLLDLQLPDISGEEVLTRLRADPRTAHMKVVVVSADATQVRVKRLAMLGADEYLTKPLDLNRLLEIVDRARVVGR